MFALLMRPESVLKNICGTLSTSKGLKNPISNSDLDHKVFIDKPQLDILCRTPGCEFNYLGYEAALSVMFY